MDQHAAIVLGATGLTGGLLVQELLKDDLFSHVKIPVRRHTDFQHPRLEEVIVQFEDKQSFQQVVRNGDILFCCIGTTQKKVKGNKALYRQVDFDIAVNAARYGLAAGVRKYVLISAVGANPSSSNFYLKLKGEVEEAILQLPFESVHMMRPSFLMGQRNEFRFGEALFSILAKLFSWLLLGDLQKYKPIRAADVAKAMAAATKKEEKGKFIYHYSDMMRLIHSG